MPMTPPDAALAIRGAVTTNAAAIASVIAQAQTHLVEVESWPATPAKGQMRDALNRLLAEYHSLSSRLGSTLRLANAVLDMFGEGGSPDPDTPPIVWSTGAW